MDIREKTLDFIGRRKEARSIEVAAFLGVSRQYISRLLKILVNSGEVIKVGSTRAARYALPQFADTLGLARSKQKFIIKGIKEHEVLENFLTTFPAFRAGSEHLQSILRYAFSEMFNNALEHSQSDAVEIELIDTGKSVRFIVNDLGIGVFRNVMKKRRLTSEFEAMQDLLKGKTTTAPKAHSGEGIFFTSKVADRFVLESFDRRMIVDNSIHDFFFETHKPSKRGTRVIFSIAKNTERHLINVFRKFQSDPREQAFDRTEIHVRLFTMGTVYVSRSQARRILTGLEKFKSVILDFDRVPSVGQAFADEVFRVFRSSHPRISINPVNMNEAVSFMIGRVEKV